MSTMETVKNQVAVRTLRPMSPAVAEVRTNINLMQEVMKSTMKSGVHFGIIPGVQKPSLWKPGAEIIMATFRLSADPVVEDLSKEGEIRFRVRVNINAKDGSFVGAGVGECSSGEEKYMWRASICQEEFDCTAEDKRRIKFKKNYNGPVDKIMQVRVNPSDLANTILKMAKKRALVDGVLTATGASDLFSQDIEDLPPEYLNQGKESLAKAEFVPKPTPDPQKPAEHPVHAHEPPKPPQTKPLEIIGALIGIKPFRRERKLDKKMFEGNDYIILTQDLGVIAVSMFGSDETGGVHGTEMKFTEITTKEFQGNLQYNAKQVQVLSKGKEEEKPIA